MPTTEPDCPTPPHGGDAVCFTAGSEVAAFGAGTIHAYLAVNRPAPAIVAGISTGALAAAAMRKSFVELQAAKVAFGQHSPRTEAARWSWFRSYLERLCQRPFDVIWDALPNASDFFADHPPIKDPAITDPQLIESQARAQDQRYRLVQLGRWLIRLSVRVQHVADLLVAFVRFKERYGESAPKRTVHFVAAVTRLGLALLWHLARHPTFYTPASLPRRLLSGRRPLFGFSIWGAACLVWVAATLAFVAAGVGLAGWLGLHAVNGLAWWLAGAAALLAIEAAFLVSRLRTSRLTTATVAQGSVDSTIGQRLVRAVLRAAELDQAVLHDFYLRLALTELFDGDAVPPTTDSGPHPVIVAAPLQSIYRDGKPEVARQLYARPQTRIVDAVLTAMALPGVFDPTDLNNVPGLGEQWLETGRHEHKHLQLIDGAAIRQNPLPALFRYLRDHPHLSGLLATGSTPSIHVVYSVPIEPLRERPTVSDADTNVVDVGRTALRLSRRCDTQLEVLQTNFMSQLLERLPERRRNGVAGKRLLALHADEIAPDPTVASLGSLRWAPEEVRKTVASGCKRTLRVLYAKEIREQQRQLDCRSLALAGGRQLGASQRPGLPEVCVGCDGVLTQPLSVSSDTKVSQREVQGQGLLVAEFPQLLRRKAGEPRIVLVASGGVFRGAFHAGMAGAMWIANAKPDLVVGASVGTLMGGVVAAMFQESRANGPQGLLLPKQLLSLIETFLVVDKKIALTMTLKTATRELGLRGRAIALSPAEVRLAVQRGSRGDAGFAATGAPPVLIDALADLFMIPREDTADVARRFIAGDVTGAVEAFGRSVKEHTLRRLGIESALMGSSLIAKSAKELLSFDNANLQTHQPYQMGKNPVAFFGTATDLGTESLFWLGDANHLRGAPYDFVQAALASSAFPFVFAPRRESELYPGVGNRSRRFSDGGMFDNLPFIPAMKILSDAQGVGAGADSGESGPDPVVADHLEYPDLLIVGALNANPEQAKNRSEPCEDLMGVTARAAQLKNNVKIRAFERSSAAIALALENANTLDHSPESRAFLRGVVNAAVLPVFPSDEEHINPTFAFCASMGLDQRRVAKSIANGCFQSLDAFAIPASADDARAEPELTRRALVQLRAKGRIGLIERRVPIDRSIANECPYFLKRDAQVADAADAPASLPVTPFACPFAVTPGDSTSQVHALCTKDPVHHAAWGPERQASA